VSGCRRSISCFGCLRVATIRARGRRRPLLLRRSPGSLETGDLSVGRKPPVALLSPSRKVVWLSVPGSIVGRDTSLTSCTEWQTVRSYVEWQIVQTKRGIVQSKLDLNDPGSVARFRALSGSVARTTAADVRRGGGLNLVRCAGQNVLQTVELLVPLTTRYPGRATRGKVDSPILMRSHALRRGRIA